MCAVPRRDQGRGWSASLKLLGGAFRWRPKGPQGEAATCQPGVGGGKKKGAPPQLQTAPATSVLPGAGVCVCGFWAPTVLPKTARTLRLEPWLGTANHADFTSKLPTLNRPSVRPNKCLPTIAGTCQRHPQERSAPSPISSISTQRKVCERSLGLQQHPEDSSLPPTCNS